MPAFQPQAFGKYFLVDKIAMGGMAEIFLAKPHSADDSRGYLVIKRILPHFTGNSQFVDMFIDEAKISSLLSHVNIVPLYDLGKINDTYFLAMEYVPGQDLKGVVKRCIDRGVRLSYEHAAYVMREVCLGLDYAHTKVGPQGRALAIVHRDISPQNVLVGYDGQVKITDFGIAKASSKLDSTQVGTLKGKFGYMAPEQVVSGMDLDHRADIFAAGVILWELITGQRLFSGRNEIEILERVRAAKIDPPSTLDAEVPRELERIIFRSLMKDRDKRYQSGKEFANDLTRFLAQVAPRFSAADMSAVMRELFEPEIEQIRAKWNVVVGAVVDRGHAELGASLEATRPDARGESIRPIGPDLEPEDEPIPDEEDVEPDAGTALRHGGAGEEEDEDESAGRTQVAPAQAARRVDRTEMNDGKKLAESDRSGQSERSGDRPEERTSAVDLLAELDAEQHAKGSRATRQPRREPEEVVYERPESTIPNKVKPPRRKGPSLGVRLFSWALFLALASATGVATLMYTGRIPNPFAAPVVEVFCGVDAMVSIDGNIVLASGRGGRWPVGVGTRTVEVSASGYQPLLATIEAAKGQVAVVDAVLRPLPDATAEIEIRSVPPGAIVSLNGTVVGPAPVRITSKLGDHVLGLKRPGYDEQRVPVRLSRPGTSEPLDVVLTPNIASLSVTSVPPGARVFSGNKQLGLTPTVITGLKPGQWVVLQLMLKGHRNETRTVTPPGGDEPFPLEVVLEPIGGASPAASSAPAASPAPGAPRKFTEGMGLLSVEVAGGWGEVYVDGVRVSSRSPLKSFEIAPGEHMLRVFNPVTGQERTLRVLIAAGRETHQRLALE